MKSINWLVVVLVAVIAVLGTTLYFKYQQPANNVSVPTGETVDVEQNKSNSDVVIQSETVQEETSHSLPSQPEPVVAEESPTIRTIERRPLEPESVKRLAKNPQTITSIFNGTGRGTLKRKGYGVSGNYNLTTIVKAESTIDHDSTIEDTARGRIRVTEYRTFTQVQDIVTVDKTDIRLAIKETLPVDSILSAVQGLGYIFEAFFPGSAEIGESSSVIANEVIDNIDGKSARWALDFLGVEVPSGVEDYISEVSTEFCNGQLEDIRAKVQSIQGKTYKIEYLQDKEGVPLNVNFTNVDGSPITDDEWDILKLANLFIDAQIIPDKRKQPGDVWEVDAEVIAGLVDAISDGGDCEGKIKVRRDENNQDGDWQLKILPTKVRSVSRDGSTSGNIDITDGNAIGDGENAYVKSLQILGSGKIGNLRRNRYAVFFELVEKAEGDCKYQAMLTSERKDEE